MTNHGQLPQLSSITTQLHVAYLSSDVLKSHSSAKPQRGKHKKPLELEAHKQKINYRAAAMKRWQFKINGVILIVTY